MKKVKKPIEFSKMLDLGKEDVANLSAGSMLNIQGGKVMPLPTQGEQSCACTVMTQCAPHTYGCPIPDTQLGTCHSIGTACYCNSIAGCV
jgi:hypothetical protein